MRFDPLRQTLIRLRLARRCLDRVTGEGTRPDPLQFAPLCVLPWIHTQIETTGDVQLCCLAHSPHGAIGNVHRQSIMEIFHSDEMNAIRSQMLQGSWPMDCAACRNREAMGLQSFRQSSNQNHRAHFENLVLGRLPIPPKIHSIDVRLNNVCNFRCRSCHGFASNRWFNEHNLVYPENRISVKYQGFEGLRSFREDFDRHILENLETIHIAGGEPLIIDAHYRLLEKLISAGKNGVELRYDTNLSRLKFKHWDVIELWRKFPNLHVSVSLDGVGRKGEYIREGLDYGKWCENVDRLRREAPHATRNLHFVVSIFNVIDFPEHYKEIARRHFVEPGGMTFTFLEWPAYLSTQVLKPELKAKVEREIRELLASESEMAPPVRSQILALIEFVNARDLYSVHGAAFAEKTRLLDRLHGQNAAELFPALESMLQAPLLMRQVQEK